MNTIFLLFFPRIKERVSFTNYHNISLFLTKYIYFKDYFNNSSASKNLALVNYGLGIKANNYFPEIFTDEEDAKEIKEFMEKNKLNEHKYICIVPLGNYVVSGEKYSAMLNVKKILQYIENKYSKYKIVFLGGKSDKEKIEKIFKNKNYAKTCDLKVEFNVRPTYLLCKKSALVIAPDGGPMHIAETAKANLLAFFLLGYTYPKYQGPLNKNSKIISQKAPLKEITKEIDRFLLQ